MGTAPCPGMVHSERPGHWLWARPCAGRCGNRQQSTAPVPAQYLPSEMAPAGERAKNTMMLKRLAVVSELDGQKHDLEGLSKCRFLGHILGDADAAGLVRGLDVGMFKQRG